MFDEQSMMPQTIETYVPVPDGAFPSSVDVHVNFEQLAMIHYRAQPHNPRLEATPVAKPRRLATSDGPQEYNLVKDREPCSIKLVVRDGFEDSSTFQEATNNQEKDKWIGVVVEEIESLQKNQTQELVELSSKQESHKVQMGLQDKASSIRKRKGISSRLALKNVILLQTNKYDTY